jgi:hypothetical protein
VNWEAIGAIGEILGALGVIVSLIYLSVQIRQNTSGIRFTARQSLTEDNGRYTDRLIDDQEVRRLQYLLFPVSLEQFSNPAGLSDDELRRSNYLAYRVFLNLSSQHYAWKSNALDDNEWEESLALIRRYLQSEVILDYWRNLGRGLCNPEFRALVEREMGINEGYA